MQAQLIVICLFGFASVFSMTAKEQIDWFTLDPKGMYG